MAFFCQKVQLKSNLRLCSIKNSRRISRKFRFITNTLTCLFLVNIVCICVGHIAQENNLMLKPTKLRSSSDFSIDRTGKYYISVMTGNFYARYINENIRTTSKGIKVLHLNVRSLQNKVVDIKKIVQDESPHIFGCSECELINIYNENQLKVLKIPGYELLMPKSWEAHGYARVVVYVKKSLKFQRMDILEDDHFQSIWIKCGFMNSKQGFYCHGYREHTSNIGRSIQNQLLKLTTFLDQWDQAIHIGNPEEPNDIFILCDMNLDSYCDKWMDPSYNLFGLAQKVHSFCYMNNVAQIVRSVTRVQHDSVNSKTKISCIDHIYTNVKFKCSSPQVISFGNSDHDVVGFTRLSKKPQEGSKTIRKRSYKSFKKIDFLSELSEVDWSDVLMCPDIDPATELFTLKFKSVLDRHAPWIKYQRRKYHKPWITKDTLNLMSQRDHWKKIATNLSVENSSQQSCEQEKEAWLHYKSFRNKVNNLKKK